jgi:hypothetical protein
MRLGLLAAGLLLSVSPRNAGAADRVQECIGEHVEAQLLRKQGRLAAARARLIECADLTCPELVRAECAALSQEVEAALPSVVLDALDVDGQPTSEPKVSIDGSAELAPIDRAIPLDPGQHRFRFEHPNGAVQQIELVLAESEHERRVVADFRSKEAGEHATAERRWPTSVMLVSGGVAAVALGSFTYFAIAGHAMQSELERCKPSCDDRADIDHMRSRYLIADVSLGVALVSVGVGAYAWTQRSPEAPPVGSRSTGRTLSVHPVATPRSLGLWATGEF